MALVVPKFSDLSYGCRCMMSADHPLTKIFYSHRIVASDSAIFSWYTGIMLKCSSADRTNTSRFLIHIEKHTPQQQDWAIKYNGQLSVRCRLVQHQELNMPDCQLNRHV